LHVFDYVMFPTTARKFSVTYYRIIYTLQEPKFQLRQIPKKGLLLKKNATYFGA
jgi:hypothetical protein